MNIGYMQWHDGDPYDLDALDSVSPSELAALQALLVRRKDSDWRDSEALARIGSATAAKAPAGNRRPRWRFWDRPATSITRPPPEILA